MDYETLQNLSKNIRNENIQPYKFHLDSQILKYWEDNEEYYYNEIKKCYEFGASFVNFYFSNSSYSTFVMQRLQKLGYNCALNNGNTTILVVRFD